MEHVKRLAARYRIVLDRADDRTFAATCLELPAVRASAASVGAAVNALRFALARELATIAGDAPAAARDCDGPLGAWMDDLELTSAMRPAASSGGAAEVQQPVPAALRAIAHWTVERYRVTMEQEDGGSAFAAASVEMPEFLGRGATPGRAVDDLRRQLEECAYETLSGNEVPPEPLQDIEGRMRLGMGVETGRKRRAA